MGKSSKMSRYFIISGLDLYDNNRGTAALGYGAFSFLKGHGYISEDHELLELVYVRYPWQMHKSSEVLHVQGLEITKQYLPILTLERRLLRKYQIVLPHGRYSYLRKKIDFVAAINGGDGLSDIYNTASFLARLPLTMWAMRLNIPVIQLPQTIGPFSIPQNMQLAEKVLKYSSAVYVRDEKFICELKQMHIPYALAKDLSAYMQPETWDVDIHPNSIGICVSGLCYSNTFRSLSGQFLHYPELIDQIIQQFQNKGLYVYLIPHSYNYLQAEDSNDDIVACRAAYERLVNKSNVILIDNDLTSPEIKYVISKMSFFIGSRMHANFAAIYTQVPVFGLAYSYKFAGAFAANGLDPQKQVAMIANITQADIPAIINKIEAFYQESQHQRI